jgi:membrane protein implicated in regulation of membrane protease activity
VHIVAIGWAYVVLMMVLAEALGPGGTVLGAIVTLLLYGVLPLGIVLYVGGTRARARARRALEAEPVSGDLDPGGRGHAAGDAIAPVREEA